MTSNEKQFDVLIAGGGPAGSVAAIVLAREGLRVCVLEKDQHPRFHIGESILPRTAPLLKELGLEEAVARLPKVPKYGAEFALGDGSRVLRFGFRDGLLPGFPIFNIERAVFDEFLINQARRAGAEVVENTAVRSIDKMVDGEVILTTSAGRFGGRVLLDCSGQSTVVGRHLGTRRSFDDEQLQKVAYFEHFENVVRPQGEANGHPCIVMCDEGWFWLIGLNPHTTSVGFVTRPSFARQLRVPPDQLLSWAIARCPLVRERMCNASGPSRNRVLADFSYTCKPYAGPGYFLCGDAGSFLDPIFSTGVTLAMVAANEAATQTIALLSGRVSASGAQRDYRHFIEGSTAVFWRLIRAYYKHSFRELFLNGSGPLQVHRAIISILAGQVFPRPVWSLRWRMRVFELFVFLQKYVPLVPRRKPFSLLATPPAELFSSSLETAGV